MPVPAHPVAGPERHRADEVGRAVRWKPALNAFTITFADRMPAAKAS